MKDRSSHYDQAAEMIKAAMETMKDVGVPDHEVPPPLADFAIWTALRLGGTPGGEAILHRIRTEVTQWTLGTHPMQDAMRRAGEPVPTIESPFDDPKLDGSPIRVAMEHMLSHQCVPLDLAGAYFVIYALGLVYTRLGPASAKKLLNTATQEFKRLQKEQG